MRKLYGAQKGWTKESLVLFRDQLLEREYRISAVAVDKCIAKSTFASSYSEFLGEYQAEARRTSVDAEACPLCEGVLWEFINDNTVRECRCRIRP